MNILSGLFVVGIFLVSAIVIALISAIVAMFVLLPLIDDKHKDEEDYNND